jgi:hypothetical protein
MADTSSDHGPFCLSDVLAEEYKNSTTLGLSFSPPHRRMPLKRRHEGEKNGAIQ